MYTVTVVIPYVEEYHFLVASLREVNRRKHPQVEVEICVVDQSGTDELNAVCAEHPNVKHIKTHRVDAGYPIDLVARQASGQYLCSLDADAFPISNKWLYLPIRLIEDFGLSFVGKQTGLHLAYKYAGNFFHLNNYYRVCKSSIARDLSERVGFCRYYNRDKTGLIYREPAETFRPSDCDNGVVAQWYSDMHRYGPKVSLAMNKILGMTLEMGVFGMVIDDLVFHMVFGFGREWIKDMDKTLGPDYLGWKARIMKDGLTGAMVEEICGSLKNHHPFTEREYWDGGNAMSLSSQDAIFQRIEELKHDSSDTTKAF